MPRQSTNLNELETKNPLVQTEFKFNFETLVTRDEAVRSLMKLLPASHQPYTDKYFLRTNDILKAEGLNPIVRAQVFIRKGDVEAHGLNEAIAVIRKYSQLEEHGGTIKALPEGSHFSSKETLLEIEGPAQDIVELETMYLGVLTRETSLAAGITRPQPDEVRANAEAVMEAVQNRPVLYFGARHWGYEQDAEIAKAAFDGGFTGTSTDIGAEQIGAKGQGTIPHALENIMASVYGRDFAVVEATKAFDKHIDPAVPRIALIDYNNKEITDAIATAQALGGRLAAVRVDTCGENIAEGAIPSN
ncbi:MAG: hypothetical protein KDD62_14365, partial [Bdellovibrionales bacterium]|nr:hypothetical protein [Bdellovibrionales bacterium]